MNRRVKRTGRRKIKLWVKLAIVGLVFLIVGGLIGYGWYQKKINVEDPTGVITETEDHGEITVIKAEDEVLEPLTYTVLAVDGESIFIDYGAFEILIDAPMGAFSKIENKIEGALDYLILTNNTYERNRGLKEITCKVANSIGVDVEGAKAIPSGETIVLGDRFSLATISTPSGLAVRLVFKDVGFLSLGNFDPDDEYAIMDAVGPADVIVAAKQGESINNRIIQSKDVRYIAVSRKDVFTLGENLFEAAGSTPIYVTGKTGDLMFSTSGAVVTSAFDVNDNVTAESIGALNEETESPETMPQEEGVKEDEDAKPEEEAGNSPESEAVDGGEGAEGNDESGPMGEEIQESSDEGDEG